MTDYSKYRDYIGITNPEMTKALHAVYRGFGRPASSFVNNPERSGVCLLPEAEALLVNTFGPGPGLASLEFTPEVLKANPPKKRRVENRKKKKKTRRERLSASRHPPSKRFAPIARNAGAP